MIETIKITGKSNSIPNGFKLSGLGTLTIITGENNAGKTNFINAVYNKTKADFDTEEDPEIIYIKAENIKPSADVLSHSKDSAWLIDNLANLFANLELDLELKDEHEDSAIGILKDIQEETNKNLKDFSGCSSHECIINIGVDSEEEGDRTKLSAKTIIRALIDSIEISEILGNGDKKDRKLDDLGQGTQRLIVISVLKAYLDILLKSELLLNKPILILFEEPEIYLHPKLKRTLNSTLEKISELDNHQVIITTHDSYFTFPPLNENLNKKTFSFIKKEDGDTDILEEGLISGIEDELLFIFLYSKMEDEYKDKIDSIEVGNIKNRVYKKGDGSKPNLSNLEYIRHQIHHSGDNPNTFRCGVLMESENIPEGKNYYTQKELSEAIEKMSQIIGNKG
ncbi:MAG: AAA family ATPase [Patescibacteria group bacterium]|nr:AAA family ATPase [Patescibacteria group bacterium]